MIIKFLQSPCAEKDQVGSGDRPTIRGRNSAATAEFIDAVPASESSQFIAADLNDADYWLARIIIPEIGAFKDYEDWLDFRVGMFWALEMAGIAVKPIQVDLYEFAIWHRTTSTLPNISALDRFARSHDLDASADNMDKAS